MVWTSRDFFFFFISGIPSRAQPVIVAIAGRSRRK